MQSYLFSLLAGATRNIPADGNLFVYESVSAAPGDDRIIVKPDNGAEITMRPGQKVRNTARTLNWYVRAYDPAQPVAGVVVIGSGDFADAALGKMVKLDGAYNNNVAINNTTANRIPISIDETQTQKVSGAIVSYTNSFYSVVNLPQGGGGGGAIKVIDSAANVNGVIINRARIKGVTAATAGVVAMMARAGGSVGTTMDGDPLLYVEHPAVATPYDEKQSLAVDGQIKVPAGKTVWLWATYPCTCSAQILYTIL